MQSTYFSDKVLQPTPVCLDCIQLFLSYWLWLLFMNILIIMDLPVCP